MCLNTIIGAKYHGEFEDRLKDVLKEVTKSDGQTILFIDEIHTVVGAEYKLFIKRKVHHNSSLGATNRAMDAGNLLKPMLGRGELRCIGATTLYEYQKYIEKDPALERCFKQVYVDQPTIEDTISILHGLRERYELHHEVCISDGDCVEAEVVFGGGLPSVGERNMTTGVDFELILYCVSLELHAGHAELREPL
ncbi:hypothetical protein AgCh_021263 [Apium graveolens]